MPSVTTILNATKPPEAREALARWRDRLGSVEAQRVASAASRRGTLTHKQIQRHLSGQTSPCPDEIRGYWHSLEPVLSAVDDVRLLEQAVFHYDLGYAGKVDCVARYQGIPCVVDWKTADQPRGSIERLYDAPLQLAAYCGAVNHVRSEADPYLSQAAVVVAVPDQAAEVFWFDAAAIAHYWQQWQARVEAFYRLRPRPPKA